MGNNTKIGDTREAKILRVAIDIFTKLENGSLTLESAIRYSKKEDPFARPQKLSVNGSDKRWQSIRVEDYCYVNPALAVADFPVTNLGTRDVDYDVVTFDHDPTTQEILDKLNEPGYRRPERDESETYLDAALDTKAELGKSPIVGLCGSVAGGRVAYVDLDAGGRNLDRHRLDLRWYRYCRFLRVRITK